MCNCGSGFEVECSRFILVKPDSALRLQEVRHSGFMKPDTPEHLASEAGVSSFIKPDIPEHLASEAGTPEHLASEAGVFGFMRPDTLECWLQPDALERLASEAGKTL